MKRVLHFGLLLFLGVWPVTSYAMTEQDYRTKAELLKRSQAQSEVLIRNLRSRTGWIDPLASSGISEPKEGDDKTTPLFRVHGSLSNSFMGAGKLLYGSLMNRLVVGSDGAPVLIELDEGQGSFSRLRLMGTARPAGTAGRLAIEVNRLLLRGRSVALQATALDPAGSFGIEAQVFSGKALAVIGAMASSFISGLAASQQTQEINAFGFQQTQSTGRNALLQGVAQTAADQSKRLIDEATAEKPILVVESQTPVVVLVQEEVRF